MNDAVHRRWEFAVKGCSVLLALALIVLLTQTGYAAWHLMHKAIPADAAKSDTPEPDTLALATEARHLAQLGHAALAGGAVREQFHHTRSKVAAHIQHLMARITATPQLQDSATALISAWAEMDTAAGSLYNTLEALQEMAAQHTQFLDQMPTIKTQIDALVREMVSSGAAASQVYLALHQVVLIDEIARRVDSIRTGGDTAALDAAELVQEIATFDRVLTGLRHGDTEIALDQLQGRKILTALAQIEAQWVQLRARLEMIAQQAPTRLAAQSAVSSLNHGADAVLVSTREMERPLPVARLWIGGPWMGLATTVLALLSAVGVWQALLRRHRHQNEQTAQLRHREQEAFAQLLDEMGALAEGDFTIKATFSEGTTGALADAINFIAQQVGARIQAMTTAVLPMPGQVEDALQMARRLAEVSQYQIQELSAALDKVQQISPRMDTILPQISLTSESTRQASLDAARECVELATDLAAMIETVHTVSTQLTDEARNAEQSLDALVQSTTALRKAANAFILPP